MTPDRTKLPTAIEGEPNSYVAVDSINQVGPASVIDLTRVDTIRILDGLKVADQSLADLGGGAARARPRVMRPACMAARSQARWRGAASPAMLPAGREFAMHHTGRDHG